MEFCYYPGCTLKTKAKELDVYARNAAETLGVTMTEVSDWQCCGAVYPMAADEIVTRLSSVRILDYAKRQNHDLLTLCSACHHVLKRVNDDMGTNPDICEKVNRYLQFEEVYTGETRVIHYLEMLRDMIGFQVLREKVTKPLGGKRIAAYYGCLLLRPNSVMQFDDPESPSVMEDFITALGGTPVLYAYRNECCGGYVSLEYDDLTGRMCRNIYASALEKGAEALITACPLCMYNLKRNSGGSDLPVYYFTELLAEVLDVKVMKKAGVYA
jgi:heterodisulfide reductase subunit B